MKTILSTLVLALTLGLGSVFVVQAKEVEAPIEANKAAAKLLGTWVAQLDGDTIGITFNADGSAVAWEDNEADKEEMKWILNTDVKPHQLQLSNGEDVMHTIIDFIDDDNLRMAMPDDMPPAAFDENSIVFKRKK